MNIKIETRKDLHEYLESVMTRTYEHLKDEQELEQGENMLKTYIIESNLKFADLIQKSFDGLKINIKKTKDKTLYILKVQAGKTKDKYATFFVDISDERFWVFHTCDRAEIVDAVINKLVNSTESYLDFLWLDTYFLGNLVKEKECIFRGFTIKYEASIEEDLPVEYLSMRLWGEAASRILEVLKKDANLKYSTALFGVGIKRMFNSNGEFVIEDITYNGKLTARGGTTFDGHLFTVKRIIDQYKEKLNQIENKCIRFESSDIGCKIFGEPVAIVFKKEIINLDSFLNELLSSTKPFRLWGLKKQISKDYYKAVCIDLHTLQKLSLEITRNWIRIYLSQGSCGNTVLRLLTNIQHYYDSEAQLVLGDEYEDVKSYSAD